MSALPDIRQTCNDARRVAAHLQSNWCYDPFQPAANRRVTSGLACLCALYRHICSYLPEEEWPAIDKDTAHRAVLSFLWADFNQHRDDTDPIGVAFNDALRSMQEELAPGLREKNDSSFEALRRGKVMGKILWEDEKFQLYQPLYFSLAGSTDWIEPKQAISKPDGRAQQGLLVWGPDEAASSMESFVQAHLSIITPWEKGIRLLALFNAPRVIQVNVTAGEGTNLSIDSAYRFTVQIPGQGAQGADSAHEPHSYVLIAAVRLRSDHTAVHADTIRLFDLNGVECMPFQSRALPGRESWGFKLSDPLPVGQPFALFYHKTTGHIRDRPSEPVMPEPDAGWHDRFDRALKIDQDWFAEISDGAVDDSEDEGEVPEAGVAPTPRLPRRYLPTFLPPSQPGQHQRDPGGPMASETAEQKQAPATDGQPPSERRPPEQAAEQKSKSKSKKRKSRGGSQQGHSYQQELHGDRDEDSDRRSSRPRRDQQSGPPPIRPPSPRSDAHRSRSGRSSRGQQYRPTYPNNLDTNLRRDWRHDGR